MSGRACWCVAMEPWSCGAVSRPAEETLARGGVSGFPQVHFDSCEEAGGSSSWRHSWLRAPPPLPAGPPPPARHSEPRGLGGCRGQGGGQNRMGPAGSDETSDVHYGRARGDTLAPPQAARHFSSPATDFPTWSCGGCVPHPAPATGQKAAARAAWGGLQGMLYPRWWQSKGGSPPGKAEPIQVCTHGATFPSRVMYLAQMPSQQAGCKTPGWGRGEKKPEGVEGFQESHCNSCFGKGFFFFL